MTERCPRYHQFHSETCSVPQGVCFHYGQLGHLKKNCSKLIGTTFVGQSSRKPRALVHGFGRTVERSSILARSTASSSSGTQGVQRPQRTQTRIFAMTADEAQANPNFVTSIITIFGEPARVLFDYGTSRSFISTSFALHADQ